MPGIAVQQNNFGMKDGQDEVYAVGVYANAAMLQLVTDTIGRDVRVETRDGQTYEGIFAGCSKQFEVGLKYAHEVIPGEETLLPRRDRVIDKLQFDPADVLSVSVVIDDEEHHKGFAMDKDIGARNGAFEAGRERELEEWVPEDEDDLHHLEGREATSHRGDGWSVEEMFNVNKGLGVESTFQDDLRQYTTVDVEGDDDAHAKAAAIAREIEMNPASKHMSMLENDDDERDLNKETNFVGPSGKAVNSPPAGYSGPSRQNSTGSQQGHRMTFSNRGGGGGGGASRSIGGPGGAGADRRGGGAGGRGAGGRGGQVGGSYSTPRSGGYGGGGQNAGGAVAGGPRNQGGAAQQQRGYQHERSGGHSNQQSSHNDFGNWADMRTQNYQEQQRQQLQQQSAATAATTTQQPPSSQLANPMTTQPPSSSLPSTAPPQQQQPRGQRRSDGGQSTGKQPPSQYDSSTFPRNARGGGVMHQGKMEGVPQGAPGVAPLGGGATGGPPPPPPPDNNKQRRPGSNITELKQWQEKFSSSFRPDGPPPPSQQRVSNAWQQGPPRFRAPMVQPQPGAQGEATAAIAAVQEPTATLIHEASQQPQGQRSPSVGAHVQHMQQQQRQQAPQVQRAESVRSPPRGVQAPTQHLDQTPESNSQRERQQSTTSSTGKRFEFNPDAPVFTPRSSTSTQPGQMPQPPPAASAPPAQSPAPMPQMYYNGGQYPNMAPSSVAPGVYGAVPANVQASMASMAQLAGGGTVYSMPYTMGQPPQPVMTLQQGGQRPRRPQQATTAATMFVGQPMQYPQTVVSSGPSPYGQVIHYAAVPPNMQQPTAIYPSGVATPHFMPAGRMLAPQSGAAPYFIQQAPQQMDPSQHQAHISYAGGVVAAQPMGGLPPQQPPAVPPPSGSNGANHSQPPTPGPPPAPSPAQHQQPSVTPQSPHGMSAPPPQQQMYATAGIVPPAVSGGNGSVMVLGQPSGYQLLYPQQVAAAAAVQQQFSQGQYLIGAQGPPPQFAQAHTGQPQQFVAAQDMQQHPYQYAIHAQQGAHGQMIPQTFVRQNSIPSAPIAPHFMAAHMPPPPQQQQQQQQQQQPPQNVMQPPQSNG